MRRTFGRRKTKHSRDNETTIRTNASSSNTAFRNSISRLRHIASTSTNTTSMEDLLTAQAVASLPPPGLSGPTQITFAPQSSRYLVFVSPQHASSHKRQLKQPAALYRTLTSTLYNPNNTHMDNVNFNVHNTNSTADIQTSGLSLETANSGQGSHLSNASATSSNNSSPNQKRMVAPPPTTSLPQPSTTSTTNTTTSITTTNERVLMCLDMTKGGKKLSNAKPLLRMPFGSSSLSALSDTSSTSNTGRSNKQRRLLNGHDMTTTTTTTTTTNTNDSESLQERLRRERQRLSSSGNSLTQFDWEWNELDTLRVLIPVRGNLYIQDGILEQTDAQCFPSRLVHDKSLSGNRSAVDAQLSPDASMVAWTADGELYVKSADATAHDPAIQLSFGAMNTEECCVSHGVADFVAQEEMDRYRGFWWHPDSNGILLSKVDESKIPIFRITHHPDETTSTTASSASSSTPSFEDHRYPFAGKENAVVTLGFVKIDVASVVGDASTMRTDDDDDDNRNTTDKDQCKPPTASEIALTNWNNTIWFDPPREASEYFARLHWLPDGSALSQWQNRNQTVSVLYRMDLERGKGRMLLVERSEVWINLHHMFHVLPRPIHPDECSDLMETGIPPMPNPLPEGSFSFLFASERTGYCHLYLYTFVPGINGEQAVLLKSVTSGEWMVEHIAGVDLDKDTVYVTGTYDSVLERHLYALPIMNYEPEPPTDGTEPMEEEKESDSNGGGNGVRRGLSKVMHVLSGKSGRGNGTSSRSSQMRGTQSRPARLTMDGGMHSIVMDETCRYFVDTSSDLDRPTTVKVYEILTDGPKLLSALPRQEPVRLVTTLFDAAREDKALVNLRSSSNGSNRDYGHKCLRPPEMISFPTNDGTQLLYAAVYIPDASVHGPGPYPLVCAVYGGPHVQRVTRSWSQCADMRAQRLRSLGFCVVKCDNRGSSRRGLAFESAISRRLGRLEVLDQVEAVKQLSLRGIADSSRVGIYGWSYGGYLSAMCLCRAPDVFHVAVAGAPVTSWDGYDTHYTERYMGLPADNPSGYRESAVFDHVPNMQGKLMIVHGLIDENVHFRHTARLINKLTAAGLDYDLLIFPDERHSPRRLRDRVYMEQRISEYFVRHLNSSFTSAMDLVEQLSQSGIQGLRSMTGAPRL